MNPKIQTSKNFERAKTNNSNLFRTVEDLYRNSYHNQKTQPIIYNRDRDNLRNSKNSQNNFYNSKYNNTGYSNKRNIDWQDLEFKGTGLGNF